MIREKTALFTYLKKFSNETYFILLSKFKLWELMIY